MFRKFIASKFKKPTGLFGIFASNVMIKGNKRKYDQIIKDLDIQPHDKLFEIGYGPGIGINTIAALYPTCTIHGMDFSPLMYKRASKYNKHYISASVGVPLLHLLNYQTWNAPAWSPDQREYGPTFTNLKSVSTFQNRLCHQHKILLMNNDNLPPFHLSRTYRIVMYIFPP